MPKEDKVAVIALYRCGYSLNQIFKLIKILNIVKSFAYRFIERYNENLNVEDRKCRGHFRTVKTPAVIKVYARIQRNPMRNQKRPIR